MTRIQRHLLTRLEHGKTILLSFLLIICFLVLYACGMTEPNKKPQNTEISQTSEQASNKTNQNIAVSDGWNISGNTIAYGGKTICQISDVDDRADTIDLCAIDSKKAFVSYFSNDDRISVMNCTADGKQTKLASLEYKSYGGPNAVYLNFTNDKQGYLLYCSDPGAGMMNKVLWSTDDGGNTYTVVKDLSAAIQNYPTDMAFKDASTGMILVSNHGADAYAYMTEDAGKTWKSYEIDTFKKCNYVNGISIEKNVDSTWNLLLQIATDDGLDSVTYTSDDEWKTWNRKEK